MPRVRLAARFLRPLSSSSTTTAHPSRPSPSLGASCWKPTPSSALSLERSFPSLLAKFVYNSTATVLARYGHLERRSCPSIDARCDLIFGLKQNSIVVGHQRPRASRCIYSSSVVYSNETTHSRGDVCDELELRENSSCSRNQLVVDPIFQDFEEEIDIVDKEEVFSRFHASAADDNGRHTTLLYGEDGEEAMATSDSSEESDLSELEDFSSPPEDRDDGHLEAEDSRPEGGEGVQWTHGAPLETEGTPDHLSDFAGLLSTVGYGDSHEHDHLKDGENHVDNNNGVPYLHTLSVNEVQQILEKTRAKDVRILQVRESCEWVDQLIFASGRSSRHLRGMADAIVYKVKQRSENVGSNCYPIVEGRDGEQWMAIDCGSIVVHLFLEEARSYYNLEEFWTKKSNPRLVETY